MQVVNATCVLDPQPGLQEWLERGDGCCSVQGRGVWGGQGSETPNTQRPTILQGHPLPRDPRPPTVGNTDTPACSSSQPLAWKPHRQVHKTQGGDDAADEADNEGAVRHEHHLCGGPHGHPSRERGILDVHLGGVGRGGKGSVLSPSTSLEELTHGVGARDGSSLDQCSLHMCHTSSLGISHVHTSVYLCPHQ